MVSGVVLLLIILGYLWLKNSGLSEKQVKQVKDLPWQVNASNDVSNVFSIRVGEDSLGDVVDGFQKMPDIALFYRKESGDVFLEAFFSKVKLGVLYAAVALEMDIVDEDVASFASVDLGGKAMPSGFRKYELSKSGLLKSYEMRVWKVAYLAKTNYSEGQLLRFFGEPARKKAEMSVEYWFYPAKGMVIQFDKEGKEIFYYSALRDYEKLKRSIEVLLGAR